MVAELHTVLASRDGKRWREVTHTIKGAARGVGAFAMGDAGGRRPSRSIPPMCRAAKDVIAKLEVRSRNRARFYRSLSGGLKILCFAAVQL